MQRITRAVLLSLLAAGLVTAQAEIRGLVAAVEGAHQEWGTGQCAVIELPSGNKKSLLTGDCVGPCFSPDRKKVAVWKATDMTAGYGEGEIHIIDIETGADRNTGIRHGGMGASRKRMALYWLSLSGKEYIYYLANEDPAGVNRAEVTPSGAMTRSVIALANQSLLWGGIDPTGTRACCVTGNWAIGKVDITANKLTQITPDWGGCNTSMSPDGQYILHNLNDGMWDPSQPTVSVPKHQWCMVRDWNTTQPVKTIPARYNNVGCEFDTQRWSHSAQDICMWRNNNEQGRACSESPVTYGVVVNMSTNERANIGTFIGFDFCDGALPSATQASDPSLSPMGGIFPAGTLKVRIACTTTGASIRYTTDGTTPSETAGTLIASGDSIPLTLSTGDTVTVKAIAYKTGLQSSLVATQRYLGPLPQPPITVTSPNGGEAFAVGDTLWVKWQVGTGADVTRVNIDLSLDEGLTFTSICSDPFGPGDARWGNYPWVIETMLDNQLTITDLALVRVSAYGEAATKFDYSDLTFRIVDPASALKNLGNPIVSVENPVGKGSTDKWIFADNDYGTPGVESWAKSYDTYGGAAGREDYFGYTFGRTYAFVKVKFTFGVVTTAGGALANLRVQVRNGSAWTSVPNVVASPVYNPAAVTGFSSYEFSFPATTGDGIRIIGFPQPSNFSSCAELDVYADGSAVITRAPGSPGFRRGRDACAGRVFDLTGRRVHQAAAVQSGAAIRVVTVAGSGTRPLVKLVAR